MKYSLHLHSDDLGLSDVSDRLILLYLRQGQLSEVSLLVTAADDAVLESVADIQKHALQEVKVSLHLDLIREVSLPVFVIRLMFGLISKDDISRQLSWQWQKATGAGITISGIDSHRHTHAFAPVAEVMITFAREHALGVRSYRRVRTYTAIGKVKYWILHLTARITQFASTSSFRLPATWTEESPFALAMMSWEGKRFNLASQGDEDTVYVVHPGLPFDSNTSYKPFFERG